MNAVLWQMLQIVLVVAISPLITGWVRLVKSRLNGRIGASPPSAWLRPRSCRRARHLR